MPMFKQCCCCCDLRTGVILIGVFALIGSSYNIVNEVLLLNKLPAVRQYIKDHQDDYDDFATKYGFPRDLLDTIETMAKVNCALSGINALAAIFLLVPTCFSDPDQARKLRGLLLVWVTWSIIEVLWSFGYGGWIISKYANPIVAAALIAGLAIALPFTIYFILVAIAFFQELGERRMPPSVMVPQSNIPYGKFGGGDMPPPYDQTKPV